MDCKSRKIVGSTPTPPHHLWGGGAAADAREKNGSRLWLDNLCGL